MITIFNRKEVLCTFSMKQQSDIQNILSVNNIKYYCRVINRNSPSVFNASRARTGTFGQNMDIAYEYIIYVHKNDYEKAKGIISSKSN